MLKQLQKKVVEKQTLTKEESLLLQNVDLTDLCQAACEIRNYFCFKNCDVCAVIKAQTGLFPPLEKNHSQVRLPLLSDIIEIVRKSQIYTDLGILRLAILTQSSKLSEEDMALLCQCYRAIKKNPLIKTCTSPGLLGLSQLNKLRISGVERYNYNFKITSGFAQDIKLNKSYQAKMKSFKNVLQANLNVCIGVTPGSGENMADLINFAFACKTLKAKSVVINFHSKQILADEKNYHDLLRRTIATFRFILPGVALRLGSACLAFWDKGESFFEAGANALIISEDFFEEENKIAENLKIIDQLGFRINEI